MEKVCPWCGQPSDRGWLKNGTEQVMAIPLSGSNLGQVVLHTCASITKQYNLVPVNQRWCPAAGKVTVGLVSHWPCIRLVVYPPMGSQLKEGRWPHHLHSSSVWHTLPLPLPYASESCPLVRVNWIIGQNMVLWWAWHEMKTKGHEKQSFHW